LILTFLHLAAAIIIILVSVLALRVKTVAPTLEKLMTWAGSSVGVAQLIVVVETAASVPRTVNATFASLCTAEEMQEAVFTGKRLNGCNIHNAFSIHLVANHSND